MMKWISVLFLLAECGAAAASDTANVEAEVARYIRGALQDDYDDGRFATFDAVEFKILSPPEWKGKNLLVYCAPGNKTPLFQRTGARCSFTIKREYLIGESLDPTTGKKATLSPFEGSLDNLKEIKSDRKKTTVRRDVLAAVEEELARLAKQAEKESGPDYPRASSEVAFLLLTGLAGQGTQVAPPGAEELQRLGIAPANAKTVRLSIVADDARIIIHAVTVHDKAGDWTLHLALLYRRQYGRWIERGSGEVGGVCLQDHDSSDRL